MGDVGRVQAGPMLLFEKTQLIPKKVWETKTGSAQLSAHNKTLNNAQKLYCHTRLWVFKNCIH